MVLSKYQRNIFAISKRFDKKCNLTSKFIKRSLLTLILFDEGRPVIYLS